MVYEWEKRAEGKKRWIWSSSSDPQPAASQVPAADGANSSASAEMSMRSKSESRLSRSSCVPMGPFQWPSTKPPNDCPSHSSPRVHREGRRGGCTRQSGGGNSKPRCATDPGWRPSHRCTPSESIPPCQSSPDVLKALVHQLTDPFAGL